MTTRIEPIRRKTNSWCKPVCNIFLFN